jgi:hypothetical protein
VVCEVSFSTVSIASGIAPPRRVIGTTGRPARVAIVHTAPANAVSVPALWLIRITPSPWANGGRFANDIELVGCAARPASSSIAAPSSAACWLVPVPTSQIRSTPRRRSAAEAGIGSASTASSCSGWERICRSSAVLPSGMSTSAVVRRD